MTSMNKWSSLLASSGVCLVLLLGCDDGKLKLSSGNLTYTKKLLAVDRKICNDDVEIKMFRLEHAIVNSGMRIPYAKTKFSEHQILYGECGKGSFGYVDEPDEISELKSILDGITCKGLYWVGKGANISNSVSDLGVLYCSDDSSAYWIRVAGTCFVPH